MSIHFRVKITTTLLSLVLFLPLPVNLPGKSVEEKLPPQPSVPTLDFCELVKHPRRYFNKVVRITASWDSGDEFSYLSDDRCPAQSDYIAVGFVDYEKQREEIKRNVDQIMSHEYGGRVIVTAVGFLSNPGEYYGYFRYRFLIHRVEDVQHFVVPYEGVLDAGRTYRAIVRGDKHLALALIPPVRLFFHQSVAIEWTNLREFPALQKLRGSSAEQTIVVSVIAASDWKQIDQRRWTRTIECKIIRIE